MGGKDIYLCRPDLQEKFIGEVRERRSNKISRDRRRANLDLITLQPERVYRYWISVFIETEGYEKFIEEIEQQKA